MAKAYDADISTEQELLRGSLAKERRRNTLETLRNVLASTVNPAIGLIGRRGGEMTTLQKEAQRAAIEKAKREELARQQAMEQAIQERAAAQQRQALAAMTSAGGGIASETGAAARTRAQLQTRVLANQRDREEAKEQREAMPGFKRHMGDSLGRGDAGNGRQRQDARGDYGCGQALDSHVDAVNQPVAWNLDHEDG